MGRLKDSYLDRSIDIGLGWILFDLVLEIIRDFREIKTKQMRSFIIVNADGLLLVWGGGIDGFGIICG